MIQNFLNSEGHQNPISGSKVTAILLQGWILPIGQASAVEGLRSTGLPRLVFFEDQLLINVLKVRMSLKITGKNNYGCFQSIFLTYLCITLSKD